MNTPRRPLHQLSLNLYYLLGSSAMFLSTAAEEKATLPYQDPSLPIAKRVDDLLGRMTLEEKCNQLRSRHPLQPKYDKNVDIKYGLGQRSSPFSPNMKTVPAQHLKKANAFQKKIMDAGRLGIPVSFHNENLFNALLKDVTHFPSPLALGSTFDPQLVEEAFAITARENRAAGNDHFLSPILDIAMDPRFGRVSEMYGEDPWHVGMIGIGAINGIQGHDPNKIPTGHAAACAKHFAAHNMPLKGKNRAPAHVGERFLRNYMLLPFKWAVQKAHLRSIMAAYNEIDGIPCHANRWLLNDVLRKEWGFDGVVVSDYQGIYQIFNPQGMAENADHAGVLCLQAGIDLELPFTRCYMNLEKLVRSGVIDEALINAACRRMLVLRMETGRFDQPYSDPEGLVGSIDTLEARAMARKVAQKAMILAENKKSFLPLNVAEGQKIAVIGPNADVEDLLPRYHGTPPYMITIKEGFAAAVKDKSLLSYAPGCTRDAKRPQHDTRNHPLIAEAVKTAEAADVIILAVGGWEEIGCEAFDRYELNLYGYQQDLADALFATGKPVIVTFCGSRPLAISQLQQKAAAIIVGWYPGQETGNAFADVVFGKVNPGGKMTMSWPRTEGHTPVYYWHKRWVEMPSVDLYKDQVRWGRSHDDRPLWVFGHGLSYTSFQISKPVLKDRKIEINGQTSVSVKVTNTGNIEGDEVVQFYIKDLASSVTRPHRELRGFKRLTLQPGESQTVTFPINSEHLQFIGIDNQWIVEAGEFDIMIGNSSDLGFLKKTTLQVGQSHWSKPKEKANEKFIDPANE